MAAAARRLRHDPVLRSAMGERGHRMAHTAYNWPMRAATFV